MSDDDPTPSASRTEESAKPHQRRGNRRVTAPATSGQTEAEESQVYDPLRVTGTESDREGAQRAEWLKAEKPPHW